jgi:long-chain acyl-CoA synthetase
MGENLWDLFVATVRVHAKRPAIVQGEVSVTFGEWLGRALEYRNWLCGAGGRPHDRVILWMDPSTEMAAALFGVWGAGGIPVLVDSMSPSSHLAHAIDVCAPRVLVHSPELPLPAEASAVRTVSSSEIRAAPDLMPPRSATWRTEPASIVFTSGSTGRPKGVTQSHENLIRGCRTVGTYLGLRPDDRLICPVRWSFDYGYGQLLTTALLGVSHILPVTPEPIAVCEAVARHRPTLFPGTPQWFTYLLMGLSPFRNTDISSLRIVANTGGTIPTPVREEMAQIFAHCDIFLNYGLTESYRTTFLPPREMRRRPTSIGKGMPGVDVQVIGTDGKRAAPGEEGEIIHRGDCVFLGYWGDPEATQMALRPDPLAPPGSPEVRRTLFTGDLGHMDENGFLYFHGRKDQQLKSMGVRVSPGEIEDVLYQSGLVREVAVFGLPHDLIGDEICAVFVPAVGAIEPVKQLRRHAAQRMSPYMLPRRYVTTDRLPRTHSGKIDYTALKAEHRGKGSAPLTEREAS